MINLKGKKKGINEGIRTVNQGFRSEKELEETLKTEIAKEIDERKPKQVKR